MAILFQLHSSLWSNILIIVVEMLAIYHQNLCIHIPMSPTEYRPKLLLKSLSVHSMPWWTITYIQNMPAGSVRIWFRIATPSALFFFIIIKV